MTATLNYTLADVSGSALGCLLFIPILLAPGYVAAWLTGVFGFRSLSAPWRLLISLPLSVAIGPIIIYLAGGIFLAGGNGWMPVYGFYAACFLIWVALLCGMGGHETLPRWVAALWRVPRVWRIIPVVWLVVAVGSLVNIEFHNRLYLSFSDFDHTTRAAFTDAISADWRAAAESFLRSGLDGATPVSLFLVSALQPGNANKRSDRVIATGDYRERGVVRMVADCAGAFVSALPARIQRSRAAALQRGGCRPVYGYGPRSDSSGDLLHCLFSTVFPELEWWNEQVDRGMDL